MVDTLSRVRVNQSVSQSVRQSGSHFVSQVAAANVATFIKVIELSRVEGGGSWGGDEELGASGRSIPLVTRIYLPVFTRNFSAICWAICKLAENA